MKSKISDETRFKQKRGSGELEKHKPFLKIRDFGSSGTSHRPKGQLIKRHFEIFSNLEYDVFSHLDFATNIYDIREQHKLDLQQTVAIAARLHIDHPPMFGKDKYVMTTDFLVVLKDGTMLAISVKPSSKLNDKRVLSKLETERVYWKSNGVEWILLTEKEIDIILIKNLRLFRQKYFLKLKNVDAFTDELNGLNWQSSTSVQDAIRVISKKLRIPFGSGRQIFTQLLSKKKILFDYKKEFSIDMPLYDFKLNLQ